MSDKLNTRVAGSERAKFVKKLEVSPDRKDLTIHLKNGMRITGKNTDGFNSVFDTGFNKLGLTK
jgi:hypothetical protein